MACQDNHIVREGNYVILKKEDKLRIFAARHRREVILGAKFTLDGIIGHPYGTTFEVQKGNLVKVDKTAKAITDQSTNVTKDNRNLLDSDLNQKLSRDDIEQMKKEGVSGQQLIEQLIENSATYQEKTEYSQQKWVKKKKKKHLQEITVLRPNSRLLCQLYRSQNPVVISNLRIDTLAQMMTHGNIRAGMKVAVVDTCKSLVLGAVLERVGACKNGVLIVDMNSKGSGKTVQLGSLVRTQGFGHVINFTAGEKTFRENMNCYNFSKEVMESLHYFPLSHINSLKQAKGSGSLVPVICSSTTDNEHLAPEDQPTSTGSTGLATEDQSCKTKSSGLLAEGLPSGKNGSDFALNNEANNTDIAPENLPSVERDNNKSSAQKTEDENDLGEGEGADLSNLSAQRDDDNDISEGVDLSESAKAESEKPLSKGQLKRMRKKQERKRKAETSALVNKELQEKRLREEKEQRDKDYKISRELVEQGKFDCLLIASRFHPTPIVLALLEFLAPSRQIIVYSQFLEAVEDCYVHLRESGEGINFNVTETWLREYQVLPNRTHPNVMMSGTGGYLLVATKVIKPEQ